MFKQAKINYVCLICRNTCTFEEGYDPEECECGAPILFWVDSEYPKQRIGVLDPFNIRAKEIAMRHFVSIRVDRNAFIEKELYIQRHFPPLKSINIIDEGPDGALSIQGIDIDGHETSIVEVYKKNKKIEILRFLFDIKKEEVDEMMSCRGMIPKKLSRFKWVDTTWTILHRYA